jgi:hypothetical protein
MIDTSTLNLQIKPKILYSSPTRYSRRCLNCCPMPANRLDRHCGDGVAVAPGPGEATVNVKGHADLNGGGRET